MIEQEDVVSVLSPITITDDMIVSVKANGVEIPEDTAPAWSAATTYATGDRVHLVSTHRVYESAKDGNLDKDPSQLVNRYNASAVATWWIEVGPTNKYAMFDTLIATSSEGAGPFSITLRPGAFNGLALFNIDADGMEIRTHDTAQGDVIYTYSSTLEGSQPADYYEYFFDAFRPQTQFIATDLVPYSGAEITLIFTKATGAAKVGMVALGDMRPLGVPLRGASVEPVDYSYISTDAFGNTTVRKRVNATGLSIQARMNQADANTVLSTVKDLLGVPVVVVGSRVAQYENLTVFGLLSGRLQYDNYQEPTLNLNVKGLI